ncbi:MAG: ATP-binding cassette domain-containing protein [Tissierellia bacterium]|nr:ATP-binding cassette domain-containing protein [Tissierellia bacterium]
MLKIRKLRKCFNEGTDYQNQVFENFDLDIDKGSSTAIIGSNGCGKSTLLNLIAGTLFPDSGLIEIDGEDITNKSEAQRAYALGRVHQDPSKGVAPELSILENMALADSKNGKFGLHRLIKKNRIDYYREILSGLDLGLENILDRKVKLLSGGQRQSLSLLMASMKEPKLLLLDEHTASLDPKTSKTVMKLTKELIENSHITTIMISHNLEDALNYCDRVIMLKEGRIELDKPCKNLSSDDLHKQMLSN